MKRKTHSRKNSTQTLQKAPGFDFGSHSFQKLVTGGIIASTSVLVISLFAYFQPHFLRNIAAAAYETVQTRLSEPDSQDSAGAGSGEDAQTPPEERESVPYLVSSSELGDISDLSLEENYEEQLSAYSVMLDTSMGPMLYYNQGDVRWGDYLYGGGDPMKKYGCGPTAVSMIINSFSPDSSGVTPVDLADWSAANGKYAPKGGSYHSLIPDSLSAYGLDVESVKNHTLENVSNLLKSGHILVALMGKGALTQNGHFILITKLLDNGNVHIADPNSYNNSTKEWSLEQLLSELKGSHDSGGPLWAVSLAAGN